MRRLAWPLAVAMVLALAAPASAASGQQPGCASSVYGWNSIELPPGYWTPGIHTLTYETSIGDIAGTLLVDREAALVPGQVSATIYPLEGAWVVFWLGIDGPIFGPINPAQDTDIMDLWWWPDRQSAMAQWSDATTYTTVSIDGAAALDMRHSSIVAACMGGMWKAVSTGAFHRSFGPKVRS